MAAGDLALRIIVTASGSQAMAEIAGIATQANRLAAGVGMAGLIAAAGIAAIGIASTRIAGDFEQQMIHIQALAGVGGDDIKKMGDQVLALAPTVAQGPVALAKSMFQIVSALIPANEQMTMLKYSGILASSGMADVLDVTKALIVVVKNYGMDAKTAADEVTRAVSLGRMTMSDYANSIGVVVQKGKQANASFLEINAALDVLTSTTFPSAQQASRNLGQMFTQVGINVDALAKRAEGLGLNFNEAYYKTLPLIQKLEYLKQITGGNAEALNKIIGGGVYASRVVEALTSHTGMYAQILDQLKKSTEGEGAAAKAWAATQAGFNVQVDKAKAAIDDLGIAIGKRLLPVLGPIVGKIAEIVTGFTNWVNEEHPLNDILLLTGKYTQFVLPLLIGLATTILILVVPAIVTMVSAINPLIWIAIGVGAAVTFLTGLFIHLYQTNAPFRQFIDNMVNGLKNAWQFISTNFLPTMKMIGDWIKTYVWPVLQQIGGFIASQFIPVWNQLVQAWQTQMLPVLKQLQGPLQQLMPVFKMIGAIILTVVIVALVFLATVIAGTILGMAALFTGIVQGISWFLSGMIQFVTGTVQFITGLIQFFSGIIAFIYDLITFNFGKLGADWGLIWQGILNIFIGMWNALMGFAMGVVGLVVGIIWGFVSTIINFFVNLYNTLIGHSIIPDMINGIIKWFSGMPGKVIGFITGMISNLIGQFTNLSSQGIAKIASFVSQMASKFQQAASDALNWGANIVHQILAGLQSAWGAVVGWAQSVLGGLSNMFPHSPVKEGPLVGIEKWGTNIATNIAQGMVAGIPKITAAATAMTKAAVLPGSSSLTLQGGSFALSSGNTILIQPSQAQPITLDKREVGEILFNYQAKETRRQSGFRNH